MIQLIDLRTRMLLFGFLTFTVYLAINFFVDDSELRIFSYSLNISIFLVFVFGKYLWKYFCVWWIRDKYFSGIDGIWEGVIYSNHDFDKNSPELKEIDVSVYIKADMFNVSMTLTTNIGESYASYCKLSKYNGNGIELSYIFDAENSRPEEGDSRRYNGAAILKLKDPSSKTMSGLYWTDRCWNKGKNTAGEIVLNKKSVRK